MDALILLGSFALLITFRMPVAYALGLSALIGAWWIDIPFGAVMIQVAGGINKFSLLASGWSVRSPPSAAPTWTPCSSPPSGRAAI